MSTIVEPRAIDAYVAAVERALGPVLLVEHRELVEDLVEHLNELASEEGEGLADRLGPPDAYAAELLASAGIEVRSPEEPSVGQRWRELLATRHVVADKLRLDRVAELRPAWWVLRAWAVLALVTLANSSSRDLYPVPDALGNPVLNVAALIGAVAASVWLGRGGSRRNGALTALGLVAVAVTLPQGSDGDTTYFTDVGSYGTLMGPDGNHIFEIWPFDGAGNPIDGVYLFDQDGNPITVGESGFPGQVNIPGLFPQHGGLLQLDGTPQLTPPTVHIPRTPESNVAPTTTVTAPESTPPMTPTTAPPPPAP